MLVQVTFGSVAENFQTEEGNSAHQGNEKQDWSQCWPANRDNIISEGNNQVIIKCIYKYAFLKTTLLQKALPNTELNTLTNLYKQRGQSGNMNAV